MNAEIVTELSDFRGLAERADPDARVPVEVRVEVSDPFEAYRRARYREGGFFTVTNDGREGWGYFGVRPVRRFEVNDLPGEETDSFGELKRQVSVSNLERGDCDVPFPCGAAGWVSYDTIREKHSMPEQTVRYRHLPRLQMGVYDCIAAWEEPRGDSVTLRVTGCPRIDGSEYGDLPDEGFYDELYRRGRERALDVAERAVEGNPRTGPAPADTDRVGFDSLTGKDEYKSQVRRMADRIEQGDARKLVASHHLTGPAAVHPVDVFDSLRGINPSPFLALVEFPGVDLVSANMQVLLRTHHGRAETVFYSGTHPRGEGDEDERRREAIEKSRKYADEHDRLLEPTVADFESFCDSESVEKTDRPEVEAYSEIFHLVSRVRGDLAESEHPVDAAKTVLPGPEAGVPEPEAFELVEAVQQTKRGPYTGAIGLFGFDDFSRLGTIIRTLARYEDEYYLGVGGGITTESNPTWEFAETINKARALVNAVRDAAPEGTEVEIDETFEQKPTER